MDSGAEEPMSGWKDRASGLGPFKFAMPLRHCGAVSVGQQVKGVHSSEGRCGRHWHREVAEATDAARSLRASV